MPAAQRDQSQRCGQAGGCDRLRCLQDRGQTRKRRGRSQNSAHVVTGFHFERSAPPTGRPLIVVGNHHRGVSPNRPTSALPVKQVVFASKTVLCLLFAIMLRRISPLLALSGHAGPLSVRRGSFRGAKRTRSVALGCHEFDLGRRAKLVFPPHPQKLLAVDRPGEN